MQNSQQYSTAAIAQAAARDAHNLLKCSDVDLNVEARSYELSLYRSLMIDHMTSKLTKLNHILM